MVLGPLRNNSMTMVSGLGLHPASSKWHCVASMLPSGLRLQSGRSYYMASASNCIRLGGKRMSRHTAARVKAENSEISQMKRDPEDVRGAISVGLSLYEEGKYQEALEVFERGLDLPGTGLKRFRDKPRSISDGEKQSILYNVACCYSRMEDARTGLVALAGCLESGYDNINQLRSDPDLEFLRKDSRFGGLLQRFKLDSKKGFFDDFIKGFNL